MPAGAWSATSESSLIVPADVNREFLEIQLYDPAPVTISFGDDAETYYGMILCGMNDSIRVVGPLARKAVYAVTPDVLFEATGGYQDGDLEMEHRKTCYPPVGQGWWPPKWWPQKS
jgi:hypothetical protein